MVAVGDLVRFIDASPSPYHAVESVKSRLESAGFTELRESEPWATSTGAHYVERGSSVIAWHAPPDLDTGAISLRIVGAHLDSPNLRIKPKPDLISGSLRQVGVEVYGSALLNSWLDRDLGLSGRVSLFHGSQHETVLFRDDRPLLRIPQLAIHLDREVNRDGLKLNPQVHLTPVWATHSEVLWPADNPNTGSAHPETSHARRPRSGRSRGFEDYLADHLGVDASQIMGWDLMAHDINPGTISGIDSEFVSSARLDNLLSCWAATEAITTASTIAQEEAHVVAVTAFFDHEEVGSISQTGAGGDALSRTLERIVYANGGTRSDYLMALARSVLLSADGAHATHPNYPERHDPAHPIVMNGGPVIKHNANQRYATLDTGAGIFSTICAQECIPVQHFVSRNDIACGSTIGPTLSAQLGISTIDVGVAQLAMHSCRELCGADDPILLIRALTAFLRGRGQS